MLGTKIKYRWLEMKNARANFRSHWQLIFQNFPYLCKVASIHWETRIIEVIIIHFFVPHFYELVTTRGVLKTQGSSEILSVLSIGMFQMSHWFQLCSPILCITCHLFILMEFEIDCMSIAFLYLSIVCHRWYVVNFSVVIRPFYTIFIGKSGSMHHLVNG